VSDGVSKPLVLCLDRWLARRDFSLTVAHVVGTACNAHVVEYGSGMASRLKNTQVEVPMSTLPSSMLTHWSRWVGEVLQRV